MVGEFAYKNASKNYFQRIVIHVRSFLRCAFLRVSMMEHDFPRKIDFVNIVVVSLFLQVLLSFFQSFISISMKSRLRAKLAMAYPLVQGITRRSHFVMQ